MTSNLKPIINYALGLTLLTLITFVVHYLSLMSLNLDPLANKIILAYCLNFALALFIGIALYLLRTKYTSSLGFIFMLGSLVKFAFFFVFFYPSYHLDLDISKLEFSTFFIPYMVNLFIETFFLIRVLNRMNP